MYPKVKVRQEDDPPEFQRICLKDFQSLSLHDHLSTKAAKHDKDGKTPPRVRVHKSHISGSGTFGSLPSKYLISNLSRWLIL